MSTGIFGSENMSWEKVENWRSDSGVDLFKKSLHSYISTKKKIGGEIQKGDSP